MAVRWARFATHELYIAPLVDLAALELLSRRPNSKRMSPATAGFSGCARLVLPVFFRQEDYVDSPDDDRPFVLERLSGVNQVTPNDIPARMVVIGTGSAMAVYSPWIQETRWVVAGRYFLSVSGLGTAVVPHPCVDTFRSC